jgi:hypothetical protein
MPAIFDLLYREYCRACLAEMRKQLLIPAERPEAPDMWDYNPADHSSDDRTNTPHRTGHRRAEQRPRDRRPLPAQQ